MRDDTSAIIPLFPHDLSYSKYLPIALVWRIISPLGNSPLAVPFLHSTAASLFSKSGDKIIILLIFLLKSFAKCTDINHRAEEIPPLTSDGGRVL